MSASRIQRHRWSDVPVESITPAIERKFITADRMTLAHFQLKAGGVVPQHAHENEQLSYVVSGALKFTVDGQSIVASGGDVVQIPSGLAHAVDVLEDSFVIDVFAPSPPGLGRQNRHLFRAIGSGFPRLACASRKAVRVLRSKTMTAKGYLVLGVGLLAVGGAWTTARIVQRPAAAAPVADAAIPPAPAGEKITLQFFRNPVPVAALSLRTLDGRAVSSADWRGKVTIVNFWATWCGPCRAEIPDLVALQKKYGRYLQVVGISQDEAPADVVRRFAAERQVNYPIIMTTPELEKAFPGIYALPTSYLIDRQGRIVQKHVGMLNPERTEQETRSLAGLPVNAVIEETDPVKRAALGDAAQATEIPGIELAAVPSNRRSEVLQKLNADACTCGCDLSVAKCRIDDPTCGVSLPLARKIVADLTARR